MEMPLVSKHLFLILFVVLVVVATSFLSCRFGLHDGLDLLMISFEMAYGKLLLKSVDLQTLSGPVVYTNMLGIPPMLLFAALGQEFHKFYEAHLSTVPPVQPIPPVAYVLLFLGCAAGTGIGYAGWWCRGTVSATSFSLIGVMNKCLTILLNVTVWDQHATPWGIASLMVCLVGGSLYRQAPLKQRTGSMKATVALDHASAFDHTDGKGGDRNKAFDNDEDDLERSLLLDESPSTSTPEVETTFKRR